MASTARGGDVDWLPWGSEAFARARAERKPILLSIAAPWSSACREMDRSSYAEPAVVAAIRAGFVAVSVDADHRPDIADRYDLGGLPSTCFLSAAGGLLGGGTFVPPDRLILALARVADASREQTPNEPATLAHSGGVNQLDADPASELPLTDAELATLVFSSFDERHAGFGGAPKFPLTAPVRLALDLYTSHQDARMLDRAVRTLDAIGWGPLYDEEDGGFFRCAARADWTEPEPEKLLAPNAALLDLYVHAGTVLGHERWFARAVDVAHYINRAMAAANGAWLLSACADPARQFSDANAATASAMLHAAAVFQDEALGRRALNALERVLLSSYKPGDGVAHSAAGIRGLLTDQVAMAAANLDAWDSTGNIVYRMMAEELAHYALRTMWDETGGGFFDRAADAAARDPLPGVPLKPFVLNCDAAMMLRRLADAVDDPGFAARARETLAAVAGRAPEFSALAAHYLLARRVVLR